MHPPTLAGSFPSGVITGSTATFGAPFYNDRVLGRLVYGDTKLNKSHCSSDDYDIDESAAFQSTSKSEKVRLINIVLVRRGKCSFTRKVSVAESKGAHAVVIIDKEESTYTAETLKNIIVGDDGYGEKIQVPSILISKYDGQKLLDAVKMGQVVVELSWDLPTNHLVTVDLWMSAASQASMKFLKSFAPMRRTLNTVMEFKPHFVVFSMGSENPGIFQGLCKDAAGKYCAEDPDAAGAIQGKDVLDEDLRQLCIHQVHQVIRTSDRSRKAGKKGLVYAEKFWDYIERFADECRLDGVGENGFGEVCSKKLMASVGVEVDRVDECVRMKGDQLLEDQKSFQAWSPRALRINGWRYAGIMDADLVTRAICSGFISMPEECLTLQKDRNPVVPWSQQQHEGVTFWQMMFWLGIVVVCIFGGLLLYKRYLKKEMRTTLREEVMLEVQAQIGEYSKMMGH